LPRSKPAFSVVACHFLGAFRFRAAGTIANKRKF
jgi:hypothetical protein